MLKTTEELTSEIAGRILNSGETVVKTVTDKLIDKEVTRRADALIKALSDIETAEKELKKIKPDLVALDADGKVVSENFSKAKFEERKKALEKLDKLKNAVNLALEKNDFGKLLSGGGGEKGGSSKPDDAS